ncbi:ABC transporter ATP-binding protein [Streptomyces ureilyticus]|uniref:ABC transporter ATP-binding protein n=1 Tax=Streptomyces ureilyticus TaxID=1775131 RepID=A0ABX0DVS6_9ACTN|nr:ABC transporter ATP-binding protein [Streptomyces ureilyticus]NGO43246.1 ABC transporter ATP-binding protein [Streptomyces ureilyticus]
MSRETPDPAPPDEPEAALPPAWRVLLGYIRPHRHWLLLGGLLSLFTGGAGLVLPLAARQLVTDLGQDRPVAGVLLLMTALVLVNAAVGAAGSFVLQRAAESVVLGARHTLVARLLRLRIPAVDRSEPGELMARVTADTTLLRSVTSDSFVGAITGFLTLVATVILMGILDPVLLAVTLGVLALAGSVMGLLLPRIRRASISAQESVGLMGAALERMLGSLRTVKASGAEHREGDRIRRAADDSYRAGLRTAKWVAIAGNTSGLAGQIAFLAVLGAGGARAASGAIDIGTLVAFLMYVFYLINPINQLVIAVTQYQVGAAAVARIQETLRLPAEPEQPPAAPPEPGARPAEVAFHDVRFSYGPDLPEVHRGVTFSVPPRGMTAFVGPSGAGKTSVFSLIERFYEPTGGRIVLDGTDLGDWDVATLRATLGYVEQDAPVLSGSLRDNLLLGAPGTGDDELRRILAIARLDSLVARLPEGLETMVGHRGTRLSGGERQRVAIARALLRRPRLLLLDEATSQLDAVNEAALRDTIADVARETTVLTTAHRLSTVMMADRIVVIDAGMVRAVGTHRELVAKDPLYAELAATQFLATA